MKKQYEKKLLIIIPAYNEAENIERVVDDLIENYPQYDYLIINDGSKDSTGDIVAESFGLYEDKRSFYADSRIVGLPSHLARMGHSVKFNRYFNT